MWGLFTVSNTGRLKKGSGKQFPHRESWGINR